MSTFLDRLETDLIRACATERSPQRFAAARAGRRRHPRRLRALAALAAATAVAVPGIAIGLGPVLRDFTGQTISTTADAPPAEQLALLGILRDPPAAAIVDPATLRAPVMEVSGLRRNYIRLLPAAPGFPHQLLYTVTSGEYGPAKFDPAVGAYKPTKATNLMCIENVESGGIGGDCQPTSVLTSGHWIESAGTHGYGLVPDGVARVVLHYRDHPDQTATVLDNTFSFQGYEGATGPTIKGNGHNPGPSMEFPSSVTWLDASGKVIATHP